MRNKSAGIRCYRSASGYSWRAFLARPVILILDEATANLNFKTEAQASVAIKGSARVGQPCSLSHRRSMLTDADWVLVLRDGKIEQQGPPGLFPSNEARAETN